MSTAKCKLCGYVEKVGDNPCLAHKRNLCHLCAWKCATVEPRDEDVIFWKAYPNGAWLPFFRFVCTCEDYLMTSQDPSQFTGSSLESEGETSGDE